MNLDKLISRKNVKGGDYDQYRAVAGKDGTVWLQVAVYVEEPDAMSSRRESVELQVLKLTSVMSVGVRIPLITRFAL